MIVVPSGTVMIGGTTRNTLDLNGGGFLQVVLPGDGLLSGNGKSSVALSADAARGAVRHIVNLPGSVEATALSDATGNVTLTGTITAFGGNVTMSALGDIALNSAVIDVTASSANSNYFGQRYATRRCRRHRHRHSHLFGQPPDPDRRQRPG